MDDTISSNTWPDDVNELKRLPAAQRQQLVARERVITEHQKSIIKQQKVITEHQSTITQQQSTISTLTQQRDEYHLEKLRLEVRLAQALKQAYGRRADRLTDPGQLMLDFDGQLAALTIDAVDLTADESDESPRRKSRRLRTRGRRDIGQMDHLPLIEQVYELPADQCGCPNCQGQREKIGQAISYTIEYLPGSFIRIKHIQHKYACKRCEASGENPNSELAEKTDGSPIDKGMPGPGLLAYVVTSKFADFTPLHRLQNIFGRQGFELDRSTMCLWMTAVARLLRPLYDRMVQRVLQSHVLATDDTVMPLLAPEKTQPARMWIYQGDASQPYNVFNFTESRKRDGPETFLQGFKGTLLADAYGGYDGVVLKQELPRAGCWSHARRKFVDNQKAAPQVARVIVQLINKLFELERRFQDLEQDERLKRRLAESAPVLASLHTLLLEQKSKLLPKHPLAEAIGYTLNQWRELTLFTSDPAVPIHNNLAEQQMKRIALLRKNALFAGSPRGGESLRLSSGRSPAAILSSLTSTCRRHGINPQTYLTELLANLPTTPISQLDDWLPDRWKESSATPTAASTTAQT